MDHKRRVSRSLHREGHSRCGTVGYSDAVNALEVIDTSFSDHRMIVLECAFSVDLLPTNQRMKGRFESLRQGVPIISEGKLVQQLFGRCALHGLDMERVNDLAERELSWGELNDLTESFTDLIIRAMESCIVPKKQRTNPHIPLGVSRLLKEKKRLVRDLFQLYRLGSRNQQPIRDHIAWLRQEIAEVAKAIKREWLEVL